MLKREELSDEQWRSVRDAAHYVILAVSSAGGSAWDDMLERAAGLEGIVDGLGSAHPLLQDLAASDQIMKAQDETRNWIRTLSQEHRNVTSLQAKALSSLQNAMSALREKGGAEDVERYGEFVRVLDLRVARSAKEGDVMVLCGELDIGPERELIGKLEDVVGIK